MTKSNMTHEKEMSSDAVWISPATLRSGGHAWWKTVPEVGVGNQKRPFAVVKSAENWSDYQRLVKINSSRYLPSKLRSWRTALNKEQLWRYLFNRDRALILRRRAWFDQWWMLVFVLLCSVVSMLLPIHGK